MARCSEAIDYINAHDRPLGLYYFGKRRRRSATGCSSDTTSGGVTVNDVVMHVAQEDLPFGGIGPAGMGAYHGQTGFREFQPSQVDLPPDQMGRRRCACCARPMGPGLAKYLSMQIRR